MIPRYAVYLFDVDGTLTNSAPDICGAIQTVIAPHLHGRTISDEFLTRYIGRHLIDLFEDLFPGIDAARMDAMIAEYRQVYAARGHNRTALYPGVLEGISALGGRKSTVTTKGTPTTRIVLDKFGLFPFFDHVQGTDGFPAQTRPGLDFPGSRRLGRVTLGCPACRRFGGGYGGWPTRRCRDVRGDLRLFAARGFGALPAGLLDRRFARIVGLVEQA